MHLAQFSTSEDDTNLALYLLPRLYGLDYFDLAWQESLRSSGYHDLVMRDRHLQDLGYMTGAHPGRHMRIEGQLVDRLQSYHVVVVSILKHRRMFSTDIRLLGLGPAAIQPGNVIMVPEGSHTPFTYRPEPRSDDGEIGRRGSARRGRLVGECYIHGLMGGDPVETLQGNYDESHIEVVLT